MSRNIKIRPRSLSLRRKHDDGSWEWYYLKADRIQRTTVFKQTYHIGIYNSSLLSCWAQESILLSTVAAVDRLSRLSFVETSFRWHRQTIDIFPMRLKIRYDRQADSCKPIFPWIKYRFKDIPQTKINEKLGHAELWIVVGPSFAVGNDGSSSTDFHEQTMSCICGICEAGTNSCR